MPRIKPTTTYTRRNEATTTYSSKRKGGVVPLTFDSTMFTFDSDLITFDMTEYGMPLISTIYNRPRYGTYIEDIQGINIVDLQGSEVLSLTGNLVNKRDTIYL